jgi:hypothetical protein
MPAVQVREIVDRIREYHRQLAEYYQDAAQSNDDQKIRFLLKYMGKHEQAIDWALADYEELAAHGVLETWIPFPPEPSLEQMFAKAEITVDMTTDQIVARALELDQKLIEFYKLLASSTRASNVQELFEDLVTNEDAKDHQYARCLIGAEGQ